MSLVTCVPELEHSDLPFSLRGIPWVQVAGYVRNRVCTISSRAVALDQSLCISVQRNQQRKHRLNTIVATSIEQYIFVQKYLFWPYCASTIQYFNFSKRYKILQATGEGSWYYSCYGVDGIAKRGLLGGMSCGYQGCLPYCLQWG